MSPEVREALASVQQAFAGRPAPARAEYGLHCRTEDMDRLLTAPMDALTPVELNGLVWDAYWTGLGWPELAWFVPRITALCAAGLYPEEDMLFYKLVLATRPDEHPVGTKSPPMRDYLGEPMLPDERDALFAAWQAIFTDRLRSMSYVELSDDVSRESVPETVWFLAAFAEPMGPFLARWSSDPGARARANLCMFLADATLNGDIVANTYATKRLKLLPANERALAEALAPEAVAAYLAEHASDVAALGSESEALVGIAFDYVASMLRNRDNA